MNIDELEIKQLEIDRSKRIPDEDSVSVNIDDLNKLEQQANESLEALEELYSGDMFGVDDDLILKIKHIIERQTGVLL